MSGYQRQVDEELYIHRQLSSGGGNELAPSKTISFNFQYVEDDLAISPAKRPESHTVIENLKTYNSHEGGDSNNDRRGGRRRSSLSISDALKNLDIQACIDSKSKYYNLSMAQMVFLRRGAKWQPMIAKFATSLIFIVILGQTSVNL